MAIQFGSINLALDRVAGKSMHIISIYAAAIQIAKFVFLNTEIAILSPFADPPKILPVTEPILTAAGIPTNQILGTCIPTVWHSTYAAGVRFYFDQIHLPMIGVAPARPLKHQALDPCFR